MKKIHNEQGYTLLLTMVLITVVVLLFATFTMKALSQQKQVEQTDDNYEVTAIAEMGVEYYQAKILNVITKYAEETKDYILKNNLNLPEKSSEKTSYKQEQLRSMNDDIIAFLESSKVEKNFTNNSNFINYKISNIIEPVDSIQGLLEIDVTGRNKTKSKIITAKFEIPSDLEDYQNSNDPNNDSSNIGHLIIPPPLPEKQCSHITDISQCYFTSLNDFKKDSIQNKTLYFKLNKNETFPNSNNFNDFHSTLYIYGNSELNFDHISGNDIKLYTESNLTINKHFEMTNSLIETNKTITFDFNTGSDKKMLTNSTVLANYLEITQKKNEKYDLELIDTTFCLKKEPSDLTLSQIKLLGSSNVYVLKENISSSTQSGIVEYLPVKDFNSFCNLGSGSYNSISPSIDGLTAEIIYK
ncbi:hypothetical protein MHH81_13655 [Psychrobacillus sp. FSL H8-0484]|uniref:hypothetical protein n=1 Tax=Psychrobacillus sp. FSL H8-0484 TaxID=2921390 RepID=UPI0030FB2F5A